MEKAEEEAESEGDDEIRTTDGNAGRNTMTEEERDKIIDRGCRRDNSYPTLQTIFDAIQSIDSRISRVEGLNPSKRLSSRLKERTRNTGFQ